MMQFISIVTVRIFLLSGKKFNRRLVETSEKEHSLNYEVKKHKN